MQEAIESGSIVTKDDHEAAIRQSEIENAVRTVNILKDNGFPLEKYLDSLSEDIREAVKETVEKKG